MATQTTRKIVHIDEEKCDGCGLCVPNCAEGAIKIINGKAKLLAENLCDGLGACLGHCPKGAIHIEERPAADFDEHAVQQHLNQQEAPVAHFTLTPSLSSLMPHSSPIAHTGCPGSGMRMLQRKPAQPASAAGSLQRPSQLGQWPVQLALVPVAGPIWENADVLIAADCVPFAYPEFHEQMLAGKTLAIACPKLDDIEPYVQKLATIFANNPIQSITVAHMEVPCCTGIVRIVHAALALSGRTDLPVRDITIGIHGTLHSVS
jgi:NAD-dependent dihydropyrimidine dehydrogenase PreA subunit